MNLAQSLEVASRQTATHAGHAAPVVGIEAVSQSIEAKLDKLGRDTAIRFGAMLFVAVGMILTAIRFMPHP